MDVQTIRRAIRDFVRFNPKHFFVQASATGFLISLTNSPGTPLGQLQLFKIDNSTIGITAGQVAGLPYDGTLTLSVAGDGSIYAQVDVSTGMEFSNLSIYDNGSGAPPPLAPSHVNQLLGTYQTTGMGELKVFPMVDGSQGLTVCFSDPTTANVIPDWRLV